MAGSDGERRRCGHCGATQSGGQWCTRCGAVMRAAAEQHQAPASPSRSRTLPAILVVAILALGAGSFIGARWWLSRDGASDATAPQTAAVPAGPSGSAGSRPGKDAASAQPASPATSSLATTSSPATTSVAVVTATVTAVTTAGTTATAPNLDPIAGVVRRDVGCDKSYVVVLGSALSRTDFESAASGIGSRYPGAKYLFTGSSCLNFRSQSAYVLYEGPYSTVGDACAARFAGTRDAYVKVADPAVSDRTVSCLCPPPGALPDLVDGSDGPYVTEAQYALQRLGFYAGDGTGVFDGPTGQAVSAFQSGRSLPADGRLTASTWQALTAADCAR